MGNENRVHAQFDLISDFITFLGIYLPSQNQRADLIGNWNCSFRNVCAIISYAPFQPILSRWILANSFG